MAPGTALPHDKAEVKLRGPARRALAFGALAAAWIGVAGTPAAQTDVPPVQRLHLANFAIAPHAEAPFEEESKRLEAVCGFEPTCRARRLKPTARRIATLHADQAAQSPVVGYVVARLAVDESQRLTTALDIERATAEGGREVWISSVGDWSYGIHVAGVRPRGEWLQLAALPLVGDAWTLRDGPDWTAHLERLDGGIVVDLHPVEAMFPDGSTRLTERG